MSDRVRELTLNERTPGANQATRTTETMTTPTQINEHDLALARAEACPCEQCKLLLDLQRRLAVAEEREADYRGYLAAALANHMAPNVVKLVCERGLAQQQETKMRHDPECELGDHGDGACGKRFTPKPGERAVLVSSPDPGDADFVGATLEVIAEESDDDERYHWRARSKTSQVSFHIHRDATWRPVEAETKAEAPAEAPPPDDFPERRFSSMFDHGIGSAYDRARHAAHEIWKHQEAEVAELRNALETMRVTRDRKHTELEKFRKELDVERVAHEKTKADWREALEGALGLEPDPENHTVAWFAETVLAVREIGNRPTKPRPVPSVDELIAAMRSVMGERSDALVREAMEHVLALFQDSGPAVRDAATSHSAAHHPTEAAGAGEPPDPLPEVLPVGTRAQCEGAGDTWFVFTAPGALDKTAGGDACYHAPYRGDFGYSSDGCEGLFLATHIDWTHWRAQQAGSAAQAADVNSKDSSCADPGSVLSGAAGAGQDAVAPGVEGTGPRKGEQPAESPAQAAAHPTQDEAAAVYAGKALRCGARLGHYAETDSECVKIQCPPTWLPEKRIPTTDRAKLEAERESPKCTRCKGSGIVASPYEYDSEDCSECRGTGLRQERPATTDQRLDCLTAELAQVKGFAEGATYGAKFRLDSLEGGLEAVYGRLDALERRVAEVEIQARVSRRWIDDDYPDEWCSNEALTVLIEREERERSA